jgi:murein DD-endopeptidase MepM/ murein hydrolase activator NlpD
VIWCFIPCGEQERFVFSKRPDGTSILGFSLPIQLVQVFILLALTAHFTSPYSKPKGKIHPGTGHKGPQGNIDIAVLFL